MTIDGGFDRTFTRTHPWLKFWKSIDMRQVPPRLWLMLGECNSKCEHLAMTPLRADTKEELHQIYLAKGVLGTTAIEGNTLTEADVRKHIDGKLRLPPSQRYLQQEIDNILTACNELSAMVLADKAPKLSTAFLCDMNKRILHNLSLDEDVTPGILRTHPVGVGSVYSAAPVEDLEFLVGTLCDWLNSDEFPTEDDGYAVVYAILKAVIAHLYMAWIHPFGDGNGRTARMLEFHILFESGLSSPAAHLLSNHYNLTRTEYYRQLDRASKSGGDYWPFVQYAVQGLLDGLREQIEFVWQQQYDVSWTDYIASHFKSETSGPSHRRLCLIQDLSHAADPIAFGDIIQLTPRLAQQYAGKSHRTLMRDLEELEKNHLVVEEDGKYRAQKEIMETFRPPCRKQYNR